ncbi:rhamnogalacturonase [Epithele typhae]|uniref:rhamnogalacturonase n=1 Tax=Epithele typhae TaxID=378194 RepID=UPI002008A48F|nr:rhamnogalacturonase [Epithele typhae]KAH9923923.1 rhamnogalacturonase [Epithele typhae]
MLGAYAVAPIFTLARPYKGPLNVGRPVARILHCALSAVMGLKSLLASLLLISAASAQLSGRVGPTSSLSSKQSTICNVLDYGGSIGSSDIGPAINSAFTNCVLKHSGSTLYVPAGNYNMQTWVTLTGGTKWAFRLDGLISRTSTTHGNMIAIVNASDFEFYSANSAGGIQGYGYQCRNNGPRLVRIITSTNWSMHDLILVDSPEFHLVIESGSNGEVYNMAIRGTNLGGSDGVDVWGSNHWIHDVEVTNRDECVTVKSPANNIQVERIWCNQSGGSAIGSLSDGTAIQNILYRNVYTNGGNQAFMIKSNLGSGYCATSSSTRSSPAYWSSQTPGSGAGVQLSNITFSNWNGNVVDGVARPPVQLICADGAPCSGITLSNVKMWSQTDKAVVKCESAYGSGVACIKNSSSHTSYAIVTSSITKPAGYSTPSTMAGDLASGFATNAAIPTPTIPTSYFPGLAQISPLAKNNAGATGTTTSSGSSSTGSAVAAYGQCGGVGYSGSTACVSGYKCTYSSEYYSQCLPS